MGKTFVWVFTQNHNLWHYASLLSFMIINRTEVFLHGGSKNDLYELKYSTTTWFVYFPLFSAISL